MLLVNDSTIESSRLVCQPCHVQGLVLVTRRSVGAFLRLRRCAELRSWRPSLSVSKSRPLVCPSLWQVLQLYHWLCERSPVMEQDLATPRERESFGPAQGDRLDQLRPTRHRRPEWRRPDSWPRRGSCRRGRRPARWGGRRARRGGSRPSFLSSSGAIRSREPSVRQGSRFKSVRKIMTSCVPPKLIATNLSS